MPPLVTTPGPGTPGGRGLLMVRRTLTIFTVSLQLLSGVSLRIRLGCHMFARGAGAERGMSDAYQVLMADTQRGRPRAPPPVSVFVLRGLRLEDSAWPCSSNYVRPVLKIVDMSSFYARAYVNLVQAAPPTAPADTLVAKVWAKYGHFYKNPSQCC